MMRGLPIVAATCLLAIAAPAAAGQGGPPQGPGGSGRPAGPGGPAAPSLPGPKGPGSLAGLWNRTGYVGSANHTARERIAVDVNGKVPPLLPAARALLEKRVTDADAGKLFPNNAAVCLPQGVPYMLFGAVEGPVQFFEEQGQVTIIAEEGAEIWNIFLDATHPPLDEIEPTFHGDSVGHWEGDTLVVDTVGLNTKTTLDQVGMPHSDAMHVVTRMRRVDLNTLEFLVTIDDPKTFSAPWTQRLIYRRAKPGERLREFVCENNRNDVDASGYQSFKTK